MAKPPRRPPSRRAGFTLIEVLTAVAITAIISGVIAALMSNMLNSQSHLEISADRSAIQNAMLTMADCPATLAAVSTTSCTNGSLVTLVSRGGGTLVSLTNTAAGATKIGKWTVRATCYNAASAAPGLHVEVARPLSSATAPLTDTNSSHFSKDPMTGHALSWADPKASLFQSGAELCQSYFVTTTCPALGSAVSGGNPMELTGGTESMDPTQCAAPLASIPGILLHVAPQGSRTCRYYAPIVHGGATGSPCVKPGPTPWMAIVASLGTGLSAEHYGNSLTCPANWKVLGGGGACDAISESVCNNSGGFITSNFGDGDGRWFLQCLGFYKAGCQKEAIANAVFADCQEP